MADPWRRNEKIYLLNSEQEAHGCACMREAWNPSVRPQKKTTFSIHIHQTFESSIIVSQIVLNIMCWCKISKIYLEYITPHSNLSNQLCVHRYIIRWSPHLRVWSINMINMCMNGSCIYTGCLQRMAIFKFGKIFVTQIYTVNKITPDKLIDSAQRQFLYYWNQFVNTTWTFVNII